ncbi:MAG: S1 RNA-binding domain-containing protein [Planctomycetaceae bacterium]|jgi:hypothetical protein|nr:S1 RNA-binding domain-containing protein [Planctomycetaceae bacterium]
MLLGPDNNDTRGARRLIAFAVGKSSYELAAFQLREFGCITVSHQTVSNLTESLSDEVAGRLKNNAAVRKEFQEAKGDTEFTADGAFIKIRHADKTHGWLECKVADFAKRELVLQGEHCSDCEQRAERAERELVKLKLIDYMSKHIGEPMQAVITTVEQFGVFVMGTDIPAEGLIRIEALTDDYYRFERQAKIMIGQKNGNTLRIGNRLIVECVRADADARQIDFRLSKQLK